MKISLCRLDLSSHIKKWYVELCRFHIRYEPRTTIKGHVLADFIVEFTENPINPIEGLVVAPLDQPTALTGGQDGTYIMEIDGAEVQQDQYLDVQKIENQNQNWTLFIDGSLTREGSGVGIVLKSPEGSVIEYAVRLGFTVKYEALIMGLKKVRSLGV